jgi:hypothetical protein
MGEFIPRHQAIILGKEIRSMVQHFKAVPDFGGRFESYPLWSMLTILFLATLCGAPRGQKDIAKFDRGLSQALGIRRNRQGRYPTPTQPTFWSWKNAWSPWMPYTLRMKPPAP